MVYTERVSVEEEEEGLVRASTTKREMGWWEGTQEDIRILISSGGHEKFCFFFLFKSVACLFILPRPIPSFLVVFVSSDYPLSCLFMWLIHHRFVFPVHYVLMMNFMSINQLGMYFNDEVVDMLRGSSLCTHKIFSRRSRNWCRTLSISSASQNW